MSNIVLDEKKWAEDAMNYSGYMGGQMETLIRMAKYYSYLGYTKSNVRNSLRQFMDDRGADSSLVDSQFMINNALRIGLKYPLFVSDGIDVTENELAVIDTVSGVQFQRLAFTLLCLSKYLDQKRANNNGWVSTPCNDIMRMANLKPSLRKQSELFARLAEAGLIRFSKKVSDTSVQVLFQKQGKSAMHISDFRNLGYQYMSLHHSGYYRCQSCGMMMKTDPKKMGPKFKYCPECAKKISVSQKVNYVMRNRGQPAS